MTLRIRHIDPDATPSSQVSLETLARIVPETTVAEVLKECNATERRTRKLSAAFVVILCVAMNLYTNDCISHVFFRLLSRVRWLLADPTMAVGVSKGALCQARYRLGARPLVALFKRICSKPLAEPETVPEAFLFGLRLMAVDGTVLDLPDTPENVRVFGKRHSPRGTTLARGCELLGRLPQTVKPGPPVATLSDGTQLVWVRPSEYERRKRGERVLVRLICYTLEDPNRPGHHIEHRLITSLVDPERAAAKELVVAYHSRWEFELAMDEIKSHQRAPHTPVRSKKAVGVVQEIYGLLIAHYVVRAVMVEAAEKAALPPSRLSFTNTLRLIREMIPEAQRTAKADHARLYRGLLEDVAARPLAPRANRCNPRVVKRKMSKFRVKSPSHRNWPQPTKPFQEAVVLLN
jgi:hypothetical protein